MYLLGIFLFAKLLSDEKAGGATFVESAEVGQMKQYLNTVSSQYFCHHFFAFNPSGFSLYFLLW